MFSRKQQLISLIQDFILNALPCKHSRQEAASDMESHILNKQYLLKQFRQLSRIGALAVGSTVVIGSTGNSQR